jgi:signal transduction histidine kinase
MDDLTTAPVSPSPSTVNDLSGELAHVTKEMYKKNLELAERNKTLSLLRKIDEIVLGSVTDTKEIAQQVVNSVVEEADVIAAAILLLDVKNNAMTRLALSQTEEIIRAELEYNRTYLGQSLPMTQTDNLLIKTVIERKMQVTDTLHDVLLPSFSPEEATKVQEILGVTKTLIYPLIVRNGILGVMSINIGQKDELLSEYQKDLIDRLAAVVGIAIDNALLYQRIQMANERLKELDKMKDEFVSLASHELRTPMTAIKSYTWMLMQNNMVQDVKAKEYLKHTYEATDRLINLVNDMLNVSRIESGRMVINLVPVDIKTLISEVITEMDPQLQKGGITVEFTPPEEVIPQVQADANKIKQVLINLIGNAIKFSTLGGKISILLGLENGMVKVTVSDTGKGILPEDMAKLFTKFGLVENNYSNYQSSQGTGLGLYICKSIIGLHGGKITAASKGRDQGSTFTFTLRPVVSAMKSDAPKEPPADITATPPQTNSSQPTETAMSNQ